MAGSRGKYFRAWQARRNSILGSLLLLLPLQILGQAYGHDSGRAPPSDTGPPPADSPLEQVGDNWHHNLIRERPVEVRLRTALKEFEAGRPIEALRHVQAVLDCEDELFVRLESQPVPTGAQHLADRLLGSLSRDLRETYEALHGSTARKLLSAAGASGDPQLLAQVVRRFFHTTAGGDAAIMLAHYWLDHGSHELAAACWQRVLAEPLHSKRLKPVELAAAAGCLALAGQIESARHLADRLARTPVVIAGREIDVHSWVERLAAERLSAAQCSVAPACGAADRNGSVPGTVPALDRPLWSVSLAGKESQHIATLVRQWEPYQLQSGLPIGAAHAPLVVGERLIFRDFEGIRTVALRTGEMLWFHRSASSIGRDIPQRNALPAEGNPDPNNQIQRSLVGGSLLGTLTSDGRHVFAVDQFETDQSNGSSAPTIEIPSVPRRQSNVLVALAIAPPPGAPSGDPQPRWTAGGRLPGEEDPSPRSPLAGHYFIGPPLPVADRLFAVSECRQQLFLSCLDGSTGAVAWSQSICSVPQPISTDYHRSALVCSPSYGEGTLVVPTQVGILIAVEPVTGRLLWAASHDDGEPQHRQQMSALPYGSRRRYGHPGYTNLPVIHQGRVVYLPAHSEYLHCFDLGTGRPRWRVRREDLDWSSASEYVAAVADGTVLVVGRRRCRGLDLDTGTERYGVRMGSSPAGHGVRLGAVYHIPLDDGRIVSLDVASGRMRGTTPSGPAAALGNLVAGSDVVVSMGRAEVTVWPQAEPELERLKAALRAEPADVDAALDAARLELALGRAAQAQSRLAAMIGAAHTDATRTRIRDLEREVVLSRLNEPLADRAPLLDRLARLASTPDHRGRYLLERALFEHHTHDASSLAATARELAGQNLASPLALIDDPSRSVATGPFVGELFRHVSPPCLPLAAPSGVSIDAELAAVLGTGDPTAIRRAIDFSSGRSQAEPARLHLARLLAEQGRHQEAELLLLQCRASSCEPLAGAATRLLAELWQTRALHHEAARLLEDLQSRFAAVDVGGVSGAEYVARFPRNQPAWEAFRRLSPPDWSGARVTISEIRTPRDELQAIYKANGIEFKTVPRSLSFDLFDHGRGVNGQFTLVDRHTGVRYPETIEFPGRYSYPVTTQGGHLQHSYIGNFVPVGATGAVHGVSLLERKLLWTTEAPGQQPARDTVRIGPSGPGYCVCQYRQHLFVLDPVDGRLLWRRDDLEAMSGLMADASLGIIGDERALVVFSGLGSNTLASAANYALYDTATGEELRRGRLEINQRFARRALGRRLFHVTTAEARRFRVWDPLTDRILWDEPASEIADTSHLEGAPPGTKVFSFVRDTDEAVFVTRGGRIRVVDLPLGETLFELPLDPSQLENLSSVKAFRDHERYVFNLERAKSSAQSQPSAVSTHIVSDATIPTMHVQGGLCLVDRRTHERLWTGSFGNRSVLQLPDFRLPVLVTMFRMRKDDQMTLAVEVIDIQTGSILASRDDLFSDSLLQVVYERESGVIALRGAKTEIRVEFQSEPERLNAGEPRK